MVEHTTPLLQPLREWSVLLVGTVVLEFGSGVVSQQWRFQAMDNINYKEEER
jgi:hypothetical protein